MRVNLLTKLFKELYFKKYHFFSVISAELFTTVNPNPSTLYKVPKKSMTEETGRQNNSDSLVVTPVLQTRKRCFDISLVWIKTG